MLVGLLPFLALTTSTSALVIDSPPASPSLGSSATLGAGPGTVGSPSLGSLGMVASPILPSSAIPTSPSPLGNEISALPVHMSDGSGLGDQGSTRPSDIPSSSGLGGFGVPSNTKKLPNGSGLGFTSLKPLSQVGANGSGNTLTNADSAGNTKRMTNGQRLAMGLGILPPTRRMTAKPSRRSATPSDGTGGTNDGTTDGDGYNGGQGNTLASHPNSNYNMRMRNPSDMSDMGIVVVPGGDSGNDLLGYSPDPSGSPMTFPLPTDPSNPFPITPGDNSNPGDDDAFNGPHKVLAAVPHKTGGNNGDLKPGSGNYALLGMAQPDPSGLLHIDISAALNDPSSILPTSAAGSPTDMDQFGNPTQLLSRPPAVGSGSSSPLLDVAALVDAPGVITAGAEAIIGGTGAAYNSSDWGNPQNALWTFHQRSSRLLAHFVNSDGNTVPTYLVTGGACPHTICLTGDVNAFKNEHGDDALEVHVLATADL